MIQRYTSVNGMWIMVHVYKMHTYVKWLKCYTGWEQQVWIHWPGSQQWYLFIYNIPRLGVQLQWAWTHQIYSLFVHRPCQISPVQHNQFLLNWVKDSEISLYWVYGLGATPNTVRQASKWHPQNIFWSWGEKRRTRNDQFQLWKLCENLFQPG